MAGARISAIRAALNALRSRPAGWLLIALVIGIVGVGSSLLPWDDWIEDLKQFIAQLGPWGYAAFALAYVVAAVLLLPTWPLSVTGGFVFGLWGFVWVPLSAALAGCAAFLLGRSWARATVQAWLAGEPRYGAIERAVTEEGWRVVALLRLSPLVPFNLMNYLCGVTRIAFPAYAFATLVGTTPVTCLYVYLGLMGRAAEGHSSVSWGQWALFALGLGATIVATVLVTRRVRAEVDARIDHKAQHDPLAIEPA